MATKNKAFAIFTITSEQTIDVLSIFSFLKQNAGFFFFFN